ncbi:8216_t:CDS:2, partial [Paraglomus brasilianum]
VKWNVDKPGLERMGLEAKGTTSKEGCMRKTSIACPEVMVDGNSEEEEERL